MLVIDNYRDKAYSAEATIIAAGLLAKLPLRWRSHEDLPLYDIIHIPTGLAIARVPSNLIKDVKSSFLAHKWTLRDNTLIMLPDVPTKLQKLYNHQPMTWEINCLIRYTIEKDT